MLLIFGYFILKKVTHYVNAQIRAMSAVVFNGDISTDFLHLARDGSRGFVIPKLSNGLCLDIVVDSESVRLDQKSEDPFVNCVINHISPSEYKQISLQYGRFSGRTGYILREKFGDSFVEKIIAAGSYWYFMKILSIPPKEWGEQPSKSESLAEGEQYVKQRSSWNDPYGRVRTKGTDPHGRPTQKIGNFDK